MYWLWTRNSLAWGEDHSNGQYIDGDQLEVKEWRKRRGEWEINQSRRIEPFSACTWIKIESDWGRGNSKE